MLERHTHWIRTSKGFRVWHKRRPVYLSQQAPNRFALGGCLGTYRALVDGPSVTLPFCYQQQNVIIFFRVPKTTTVDITLTNRYAWVTEASPEVYQKLRDFYSYFAPGARWSQHYKLYLAEKAKAIKAGEPDRPLAGWDGKIKLFLRGKVPAGLFRATKIDAQDVLGIRFRISKELPELNLVQDGLVSEEQYQYQNDCTDAMVRSLRRGGGIVLACTGAGKTKTAANFFSRLDYSCLFLVHRKNLLYQSQEELARWLGCKVGIVGDSVFQPERITVAMIQTLAPHMSDPKFVRWFKKIKVVLVDELHKQMAMRNFDLLHQLKPLACYGLTATLELGLKPVRYKAWAFAGPVIFRFPLSEGVKKKVVTSGRVLQVLFPLEFNWTYEDEDYENEYMYEVVHNELKQRTCKALVKELIARGRAVIVIVERVAHVEALHEMFGNIEHGLAYGKIKKKERDQVKADFESGKINLIIANQVFKDGIDIKRASAIIDMAEWKSKNDTMQKFGRGVRLHEDKTDLLYVDFGTQTGRFATNGRRRKKALVTAEVPVKTVKAHSAKRALRELRSYMDGN